VYFFSLSFLIELVTSIKHSINFSTTKLYTAHVYSNGISEETIGKALEKYNIPRHKVAILSKCFAYVGDKPWMQNPLEVKLLARKHEKALHKLIIGPGGQGK
jgi:predicted oxidoreductase